MLSVIPWTYGRVTVAVYILLLLVNLAVLLLMFRSGAHGSTVHKSFWVSVTLQCLSHTSFLFHLIPCIWGQSICPFKECWDYWFLVYHLWFVYHTICVPLVISVPLLISCVSHWGHSYWFMFGKCTLCIKNKPKESKAFKFKGNNYQYLLIYKGQSQQQ